MEIRINATPQSRVLPLREDDVVVETLGLVGGNVFPSDSDVNFLITSWAVFWESLACQKGMLPFFWCITSYFSGAFKFVLQTVLNSVIALTQNHFNTLVYKSNALYIVAASLHNIRR